jgi:DNA-binding beta-propeller fold protein YncE
MDSLFVCNTASDYISKINLQSFVEEKKIWLCNKAGRVGPHGICGWRSDIIVANCYGNSISRIDIVEEKEVGSFYIGGHCNDVAIIQNDAYVTCGESNSIIIYDLYTNKIQEEIPCGNLPHSIEVNQLYDLMVVANMESDSITLLNYKDRETVKELRVGKYPTKAVFSKDGKYILVCESNLGSDRTGFVSVISVDTLSVIKRIPTGRAPIDLWCDDLECYVSNFNEGTVSVIYLEDLEEVKKFTVGGMPRGIMRRGRYLYIGDNYSSLLIKYDIYKENKKVITIGGEPTGMTLI